MSDWLHPYDEGYPHEEVMSAEPMTEAGRRLSRANIEARIYRDQFDTMILAIEREAAALLRQRVEGLRPHGEASPDADWGWHDAIAAVLALFDTAPAMARDGTHRLLMPPHPGEVYEASALCSCGEWQYDADSFGSLTGSYTDVLRDHTAHATPQEKPAVAERETT